MTVPGTLVKWLGRPWFYSGPDDDHWLLAASWEGARLGKALISVPAAKCEVAPRITVLLDCDGVLSDFMGAALEIVANVTGRRYALEDVDRFNFTEALGLNDDETRDVCDAISLSQGWCASLGVLPGAVEGVRAIETLADVYVVTAPWNSCATWMSEREQWLLHQIGIPATRVLHGFAKHMVYGHVFVDDKTSTVQEWSRAWPNGTALRWATPHNRNDPFTGTTVSTWDEVLRHVETAAIRRMRSSGR